MTFRLWRCLTPLGAQIRTSAHSYGIVQWTVVYYLCYTSQHKITIFTFCFRYCWHHEEQIENPVTRVVRGLGTSW